MTASSLLPAPARPRADEILLPMVETANAPRRPGRPRAKPATAVSSNTRADILDAAADLFVRDGLSTTTRDIAEKAGIRQASMYHYFPSKHHILLELLAGTVRPSLSVARELHQQATVAAAPAAGLYALAHSDITMLSRAPRNVATLYLLPEVQNDATYAPFRATRSQLQQIYGRMGVAAAPAPLDKALTGSLLMQIVETVISLRKSDEFELRHIDALAESCLRALGLTPTQITAAITAAEALNLG